MTPDMENPLHSLPHYVTGEYAHNKTFLEDNEYARALDCFVKGVVDVFLTDPRGKILLGHRLVHPQPDWWVLGGRMRAGDTPAETARRNAIRETRLDIAPERWEFVCAHTMLWQFRKQAPSGERHRGLWRHHARGRDRRGSRADDDVQRGVRRVRVVHL